MERRTILFKRYAHDAKNKAARTDYFVYRSISKSGGIHSAATLCEQMRAESMRNESVALSKASIAASLARLRRIGYLYQYDRSDSMPGKVEYRGRVYSAYPDPLPTE